MMTMLGSFAALPTTELDQIVTRTRANLPSRTIERPKCIKPSLPRRGFVSRKKMPRALCSDVGASDGGLNCRRGGFRQPRSTSQAISRMRWTHGFATWAIQMGFHVAIMDDQVAN